MNEAVVRPKAPTKKINSKNEFELCYIRHQYIRKSMYNPTEAEMKPYYDIIKHFSQKTYYTYMPLFRLVGFESEDITNICKIHLVSFLGLFSMERVPEKYEKFIELFERINQEKPNPRDLLDKNKANFTCFLKQRLEDIVRVCRQKARNIKGKQTDEYLIFYGAQKPPEDLNHIATQYNRLGYKKLDYSNFKSIKRKIKGQTGPIYLFEGVYYICVDVDAANLRLTDLIEAGYNPYESLHNMNPEDILAKFDDQNAFEAKKKRFLTSTRKYKNTKLKKFISLHKNNPRYTEEVQTARKMLKSL